MNSLLKPQNAWPLATLLLAGLFVFTIGIAMNYTYMDEVYFADPVINYLHGDGYTTSAWNQTKQFETHVSTAPAYSLLLMLWLKMFGISQAAARCLPATLALASAAVFWRACVRAGLVTSGAAGVLLIAVLICDYGYAFSYTCGRPDALAALLMAAMFYFSTGPNRPAALVAVGVIALLLPFVQWGCVLYVFFLCLALVLVARKKAAPFALTVCLGVAVGLLAQKMIYTHLGLWDIWMKSIAVSEGSGGFAHRLAARLTPGAVLHHNSNTLPKDFSVLLALAGLGFVYLRSQWAGWRDGTQLARSAWIIGAVVTVGMYCVGKFPTYYGWMLALPLAAIIAAYFDRARAAGRRDTAIAVAIALAACGVGLPLQVVLASHDWPDRHPAAMTAWLAPKIAANDVVYCDYPFYFTAKARARHVFAGFYFTALTREEFDTITLAVIAENDSAWKPAIHPLDHASLIGVWQPARSGILGNNWKYGILSAPNYQGALYRLPERGK